MEAARPLELEAIVGAIVELGDKMKLAMPYTRAVYACAKLLDKGIRESHRGPVEVQASNA